MSREARRFCGTNTLTRAWGSPIFALAGLPSEMLQESARPVQEASNALFTNRCVKAPVVI
jgi:hypothetical protein